MGIFGKLFDKSNQTKNTENSESAIIKDNISNIFKQNLKYISQTKLPVDIIARQFVRTQTRYWLTVGTVDFPTGKVIVADPLYYLFEWGDVPVIAPVLEINIPKGSYRVDVSICRNEYAGIRMCTARLKIKDTAAVRYELALPTEESAAAKLSDGVLSGFPVDGGMMCFCDAQVAEEYRKFLSDNHINDPYPEYFSALFAESEKKLPAYQREGGDFIEWTNPISGNRMTMISSGFGDGFYQNFWGYDELDELCELVVPMVNPDLFE